MAKYRKLPVVIEAIQYTGNNVEELELFADADFNLHNGELHIATLEGNMRASIGDYIIKGISGECYPCKPDIFERTYEAVNE